jgi:hypothetical protein
MCFCLWTLYTVILMSNFEADNLLESSRTDRV